jgi:NAD(P)-dependent dehydrogenase (short-subunit alcohol dehydrogenase family)
MKRERAKVVAITGGGRGIGRETARAFASAEWNVAIGDIDTDVVARTAPELGVLGLELDVTDRQSFAAFLDATEVQLGELDVLVNNAGILPVSDFLDEDDSLTDRVVDINIRGVMTGSKLAGRRFRDRGRGHIINVSSLLGTKGAPRVATYCATKFAIVGFSEALRLELARSGVHVTNVMPSFTRTDIMTGVSTNWLLDRLAVADPEDVAAAILAAAEKDHPPSDVAVPSVVGYASRAGAVVPRGVRDTLFRALGAERIARDVDQTARAAYSDRFTP